MTCLARPTTVFTTFFTLLSISQACQAKVFTSLFPLALASHISLHPVFLLPPMILLTYDRICLEADEAAALNPEPEPKSPPGKPTALELIKDGPQRAVDYLIPYFVCFLLPIALSRFLVPSWNFVESLYLTPLSLPDLTPNPGLWWYFFIELFDPFRNFFLGVFWLHMFAYSIPLCLKFQRQPLAAVVLMLGVTAVFQPYANIGDAGTWLSALCLLSHDIERKLLHSSLTLRAKLLLTLFPVMQ